MKGWLNWASDQTSAPNPKFAHIVPRVSTANFGFKGALES
jgi:hypothetical protein